MTSGGLLVPHGLEASLVLLRHGESVAITEGRFQGRLDTPLSDLGRRQAELAGGRLAHPAAVPRIPVPDRAPFEVLASPLSRTLATADAVVAALRAVHGPAVPGARPDAGLVELGQGLWEGMHRDDVVAGYPSELEAWQQHPLEAQAPEGERVLDAAVRVHAMLTGVVDRLADARAAEGLREHGTGGYPASHRPDTPWSLLVGHDGVFKVALLMLLGLPLDHFWTFPWGLTGISVVELVDGRAVLRTHNLTGHLGPLQVPVTPALAADEAVSEDEADVRERTGSL